jgi:hypothetical protein
VGQQKKRSFDRFFYLFFALVGNEYQTGHEISIPRPCWCYSPTSTPNKHSYNVSKMSSDNYHPAGKMKHLNKSRLDPLSLIAIFVLMDCYVYNPTRAIEK